MALCMILDDIIVTADSGRITVLVSLYIFAAFDVADHAVLIQRREEEFGIIGTCKNRIMSYLTGRSSPTVNVTQGVPQESVLGLLLYTVYIAPVGRLIHHHS